MWLVTDQAVTLEGEPAAQQGECIAQSLVDGLVSSVLAEFPEARLRWIDVRGSAAGQATQIAAEVLANSGQTAVCRRGDQTYVRTLQAKKVPLTTEYPLFGTWLVTGGLGSLGLSTAGWLARKGIRHLVLLGRSSADESPRNPGLQALQANGVNVLVRSADCADYEALRSALDLPREWPALSGMIHAAGCG